MAKVTLNKRSKHTSTNNKDMSQLSVKQRLFARYKAQGLSQWSVCGTGGIQGGS